MTEEFSEEIKKEIFKLISTPGVQVEDIPERSYGNIIWGISEA